MDSVEITFAQPLDCTDIFPEGGTATGATITDASDGTLVFSLIGAGEGRVIGCPGELETAAADIVSYYAAR